MINTILKPYQFSSFSEERLESFENRVGELPHDYKTFLRDVNGGEMIKDVLYLDDEFYYVAKLFGLHNTTNYWANIEWFLENESLLFPYKTIPIGDNSGGDYYILNLQKGENYGGVYFWSHEINNSKRMEVSDLSFLSSSFELFIDSLIKEEDDIEVNVTITDDSFIIE